MRITVTVKANPEVKGEPIRSLFKSLKQHFARLKKDGAFGPQDKCELRFLFEGEPHGEEPVE